MASPPVQGEVQDPGPMGRCKGAGEPLGQLPSLGGTAASARTLADPRVQGRSSLRPKGQVGGCMCGQD